MITNKQYKQLLKQLSSSDSPYYQPNNWLKLKLSSKRQNQRFINAFRK